MSYNDKQFFLRPLRHKILEEKTINTLEEFGSDLNVRGNIFVS